jgi:hypothetical protein
VRQPALDLLPIGRRNLQGEQVAADEVFEVLSAQDSLIRGSLETCRKEAARVRGPGHRPDDVPPADRWHPARTVLKSTRLIGELPDLE